MTKTVLVIGCSFSRAFEDPQQKGSFWSWSELLAKDLGEDWNVWNYSVYCNSVSHQNILLYWLLEKYHKVITHVIVQHTTNNRTTMIEDPFNYSARITDHNILVNEFNGLNNYLQIPEDLIADWHTKSSYDKLGSAHINAGSSFEMKRWRNTYEDLINHNVGSVGPYTQHFTTITQKDMKRLVESYNKPYICYSHYYANNPEVIERDYYIEDRSYLDFILQFDMPNFNDYVIDNGYHFSKQGNQKIVSDWILPRLLDNV